MKIRKGDTVVVLTGKDKGKQGEVVTAFPAAGKVIVEGVNVAKRHQKPTRSTQQGGIIDKAMPINVSNVGHAGIPAISLPNGLRNVLIIGLVKPRPSPPKAPNRPWSAHRPMLMIIRPP